MVDEEELLSLLALRRAGISLHELFALFSPTFTELNLGLPSRKAAYQSEITSYWDEARAELEACQQAEIKVLPFFLSRSSSVMSLSPLFERGCFAFRCSSSSSYHRDKVSDDTRGSRCLSDS